MNDDEKTEIQNRLKSKVVWTAIIAQVVVLVTIYNPQIADTVKTILTAVCEIATAIGILNNPTDKVNW